MQPSMFNMQVPVADQNEVFLMNTFTDAQLLASMDVTALLDRISRGDATCYEGERETVDALIENGFLVESREAERRSLDEYFTSMREDTEQLKVTVLTTLQCNFACDYCFQGDHGDYNKFAAKMSLETARNVTGWIEHRPAGAVRAHPVRRRAAAEPAHRLFPRGTVPRAVRAARRAAVDQPHHQRAAADA